MTKPKGIYILGGANNDRCYSSSDQEAIADLLEIKGCFPPAAVLEDWRLVEDVEVILSSWGGPTINNEFLEHTPALKAVFYAAGSIRGIVTDAFWERNIIICSAWGANAIPVAEYTLSQILWALKLGHHYTRQTRNGHWQKDTPVFGAYGSVVGIISLGMIGRLVCKLLQPFDVKIIAYAPFVDTAEAKALGVQLVELDELFERAVVVSLHTPNLPETRGLITGAHLARLPRYATFINTARGAVVNEPEMIATLQDRSDIQAVLDVTYPEPPAPDSPLYTLENVVLTPHIAGSMDSECHRLGNYMRQELERYLNGESLRWQVTREMAERMA